VLQGLEEEVQGHKKLIEEAIEAGGTKAKDASDPLGRPLQTLLSDHTALLEKDENTEQHSLSELILELGKDVDHALEITGHHEAVTYNFKATTAKFRKQMQDQDHKDEDLRLHRTTSEGDRARASKAEKETQAAESKQ
jgi:hypothetical protein